MYLEQQCEAAQQSVLTGDQQLSELRSRVHALESVGRAIMTGPTAVTGDGAADGEWVLSSILWHDVELF